MNPLWRARFHELLTVPSPLDSADGTPARVPLFAALAAAHAELLDVDDDTAILVAWERPRDTRRIRILLGGIPHFPPAGHAGQEPTGATDTPDGAGATVPMMYPPGAGAREVDAKAVVAGWSRLPVWVRCAGRADALSDTGRPTGAPAPGRGGFEDYVAHLPGEFVWLVYAQPLSDTVVDAELARLEVQLPRWRARENSEPDRIALARAESRYRELTRARCPGMWAVHLLVGASTELACRRAAGLLCSAADLDDLPYVLTPDPVTATFDTLWRPAPPDPGAEQRSPFTASTELLAALARPPARELPGIRVVEPPEFDLTPEREGGIDLGAVLDNADRPTGRFHIGLDTLNRHGFIAGATGSGKSQTVRHLLEGLHTAGVPWLVIEPAKAEYAAMAGRVLAPVTVIRPGDPHAVPAGLNPLEPAPGFPLQTHLDLVRALFLAAFDAVEPFPQVLSHALARCYHAQGWDTILGTPIPPQRTARYPTLTDLQTTALDVVEGIGYSREITDNVRGFIDVRLGSLRLGTPGRFFDGGYRLDITDLLTHDTVLEIEDIGSDADKAFFIGAILIRVFEHLRTHPPADGPAGGGALRHVTVIEEAHRLLRRAEPGTPTAYAVELFTSLLAEIRAYGAAILVAEQIPTKISPDVVKNTALKVLHRLPAADDRDLVGATINLTAAQSRHVVSLPPGRAVVFTDGMDRPLRVQVPYGGDRETRSTTTAPKLSPPSPRPPSTLTQLHTAQRLAEDAAITLWIELVLLSHLVGRPAPRPGATWVARLTDTGSSDLLEEAVAHRLRTGVDDRYAGLARYYHPDDLFDHLLATTTATVRRTGGACGVPEPEWQAGRYRWADVEHALQNPGLARDRPHPDTAAWARRGLHLPATDTADQRHALHSHPDNHTDRRIVTGYGTPTVLAASIARLSGAPTIEQQLAEATAHLNLTSRWPLALLLPLDPAPDAR